MAIAEVDAVVAVEGRRETDERRDDLSNAALDPFARRDLRATLLDSAAPEPSHRRKPGVH